MDVESSVGGEVDRRSYTGKIKLLLIIIRFSIIREVQNYLLLTYLYIFNLKVILALHWLHTSGSGAYMWTAYLQDAKVWYELDDV